MRRRKTPETPIAAKIRTAAAVYASNGQKDRAEGMVQAADMVDELAKRDDGSLADAARKFGYPPGAYIAVDVQPSAEDPGLFGLDEIRHRLDLLEAQVFNRATITYPARKPRIKDANGLLETPVFRPLGSATEPRSPMDTKMLAVLAQRAPVPTTGAQLAILTGYSKSGSFSGALARLRKAGWIAGDGNHLVITDTGYPHAPEVDPTPRGDKLLEFWCERVGTMGAVLLQRIVAAYPTTLTVDDLVEMTGYKKSGSLSGALAVLRTLDLITRRGAIKASEELMQGIGT